MAIGQRIKFFRNRKGMTQKQLGEILGFLGKTSDVRMAQYESEARVPKIDLVKEMAQVFDVSTRARSACVSRNSPSFFDSKIFIIRHCSFRYKLPYNGSS